MNYYLIESFKSLGKNQKEIITDLKKSQPYVSALMNGKKKVGKDIAKQLSKLYGFDEGAVLTGEGEMLNTEAKVEVVTMDTPLRTYTGYYYPDVSASAGLETALENTEIVKIPITIPTWGKGLTFINVFGDSMYPKYCSGEIIGLKEIEYQYLNYGYAYVVVMNDGEVYLKYLKKGSDNEHLLFVSENKDYDSREFHISLIKSFYIVKGVITKVTM